jgi:hypothetical protein
MNEFKLKHSDILFKSKIILWTLRKIPREKYRAIEYKHLITTRFLHTFSVTGQEYKKLCSLIQHPNGCSKSKKTNLRWETVYLLPKPNSHSLLELGQFAPGHRIRDVLGANIANIVPAETGTCKSEWRKINLECNWKRIVQKKLIEVCY